MKVEKLDKNKRYDESIPLCLRCWTRYGKLVTDEINNKWVWCCPKCQDVRLPSGEYDLLAGKVNRLP